MTILSRQRLKVTLNDYELLAGFRQALREFIHFSEQAALAADLPPHQHQAMLVIKGLADGGRITVGDLASHLKIRHQSAVGLVHRMVASGLVRKRADAKDRRAVLLELSAKGERLLKKLSVVHKEEITRLAPKLQATLKQLQKV